MRVLFESNNITERIVSLAICEETADELTRREQPFIYVTKSAVILFPERLILSMNPELSSMLLECCDYDLFEIHSDGRAERIYDSSESDFVFFITGACNSNCVMCPSPESTRKNCICDIDYWMEAARNLPSDINHLTITGGEPFMAGKDLFRLLGYCQQKFGNTEVQILTNGRIFAVNQYCRLLKETIPEYSILGIPLHGSTAELHDAITRTPNSFIQTVTGIKKLIKLDINVEIRIVVTRLNATDLINIADFIIREMYGVHHVCIMAAEMTGNAHVNFGDVWIEYRESFEFVEQMIRILVDAGIDTVLYNYPLCTVKPEYRTLCEKSISPGKVRYSEQCNGCAERNVCGGLFSGTIRYEAPFLRRLICD